MDAYIVLDIETTGISPEFESITEIGAARISNGKVVETYDQLVNPKKPIPRHIVDLTGITDQMVEGAPTMDLVMPLFIDFCGALPILGHNVSFDYGFLKTAATGIGQSFEKKGLDTMVLSRRFLKQEPSYSLTNLIKSMGIHRVNAHRGLDDALATSEIYEILRRKYNNLQNKTYFEPRPIHYRVKKQSPITDKQKKYLTSLIRQHNIVATYEVDRLTKSEASKRIDGILHRYGRSI